ncbi:MAG: hypothetical protein GKR94_19155 [Gammaproteobacteria bacterium]|nr:hypothetical protein [Gammaproteobacteria bacterium]
MKVWLYGPAAAMSKRFDGLSALVRTAMGDNPLDGSFVGVRQPHPDPYEGPPTKALYRDADGECIRAKRLERERLAGMGSA